MSASSRPFCISAVLRNTVLAVRLTTESASADKCAIARSISSLSIHQLASRPWVGSQAQAECLQKGVVFRARLFVGRDKGRRKPCVCDHAIERKESGGQANTPKDDAAGNRMNSLGQRNQFVIPAMISESRQTVTRTTMAIMILRALEFSSGFTVCLRQCASDTLRFNRNVEKRRSDFSRIIASWSQRLRVFVR